LVQERDIKDRMEKHFHKLFNEVYEISLNSNNLDMREEDRIYNHYSQIKKYEVNFLKKDE